MLSAYVLIETEVGKVAHVAHALHDLDGVQVAEASPAPTTSSPRSTPPVWISSVGWWPPASRPWTASPAPSPAQ
jgi:hypothetical protein